MDQFLLIWRPFFWKKNLQHTVRFFSISCQHSICRSPWVDFVLATLYFTSVVILADSIGLIIFFHHNVSGESAELCFFCLPNITAMHCRQKYWDFSCFLIILFSSVYGTETESLIWCHYIYCKISKINLILFHVFWSVVC